MNELSIILLLKLLIVKDLIILKKSREKDEDIGLFKATFKLFNDYNKYEDIFKM